MISLTSLNFSWTGNNNTDIVELLYQIYSWWIEDEKKSDDDLRIANKVCLFFFVSRCCLRSCALSVKKFIKMYNYDMCTSQNEILCGKFPVQCLEFNKWQPLLFSLLQYNKNHVTHTCGPCRPHGPFKNPLTRGRNT